MHQIKEKKKKQLNAATMYTDRYQYPMGIHVKGEGRKAIHASHRGYSVVQP